MKQTREITSMPEEYCCLSNCFLGRISTFSQIPKHLRNKNAFRVNYMATRKAISFVNCHSILIPNVGPSSSPSYSFDFTLSVTAAIPKHFGLFSSDQDLFQNPVIWLMLQAVDYPFWNIFKDIGSKRIVTHASVLACLFLNQCYHYISHV